MKQECEECLCVQVIYLKSSYVLYFFKPTKQNNMNLKKKFCGWHETQVRKGNKSKKYILLNLHHGTVCNKIYVDFDFSATAANILIEKN